MVRAALIPLMRRAYRRALRNEVIRNGANSEFASAAALKKSAVYSFEANRPSGLSESYKAANSHKAASGISNPKIYQSSTPTPESTASVLVVGAGLAGLTVAYRLQQAGVLADIVEASDRVGGRVESVPNVLGTSLTAELGAEFIDSNHCCVLALAAELGLTLLDRELGAQTTNLRQTTLFFEGQWVDEATLAAEFAPAAGRIAQDLAAIESFRTYRSECLAAIALDGRSLTHYLDDLPLSPLLRQLIEVAYKVEFGRELAEQSCLNFLYLVGFDPHLELLGTCDERFYIAEGNDQLAYGLAARLQGRIEPDTELTALARSADGRYRVSLRSGLRSETRCYERVVLALPFSVVRSLDIRLNLPPAKRLAINTLGYGSNAKLTAAYSERTWHIRHAATAHSFTDLPFHNTWESDISRRDPAGTGLLTSFVGGKQGAALSARSPEAQAQQLRSHWNRVFPGLEAAHLLGALARPWASAPYSRGSYACYLVGQWTQLYGVERERVENLFFAGEHCSVDFQACMEGACQSGEQVALEILKDLGLVDAKYSLQTLYGARFRQSSDPLPF
jgi:monoamine oxidase